MKRFHDRGSSLIGTGARVACHTSGLVGLPVTFLHKFCSVIARPPSQKRRRRRRRLPQSSPVSSRSQVIVNVIRVNTRLVRFRWQKSLSSNEEASRVGSHLNKSFRLPFACARCSLCTVVVIVSFGSPLSFLYLSPIVVYCQFADNLTEQFDGRGKV